MRGESERQSEHVAYMWNLLKGANELIYKTEAECRVAEAGKAHSWQRRKAGGGRWAGAWDEHAHVLREN